MGCFFLANLCGGFWWMFMKFWLSNQAKDYFVCIWYVCVWWVLQKRCFCNVEFTTFTILHTYVDVYTSHIQQHAAPVTSRTLGEEPDGVHPLQVEGVCMCQIILGDFFVWFDVSVWICIYNKIYIWYYMRLYIMMYCTLYTFFADISILAVDCVYRCLQYLLILY